MSKKGYLILFLVGLALAIVFMFLPPKLIISWGLGIARHNDRVMIGTVGLILAYVSAYKLFRLVREQDEL
ncbi:hypothetical protein HY490_00390 [Candidatus Woesearchaeota archaeon]|nr:hypothetical protein [Candidatus Woesearchaeota archaeon]